MIKGGDLDNAIVIVDKVIDEKKLKEISKLLGKKNIKVDNQGILNNIKLKYNNEPARHKLLEIPSFTSQTQYMGPSWDNGIKQ